jgi:hypothetical protein
VRSGGRRAAGLPLSLPRWWAAVFAAVLVVVVGVVVVIVRTKVAPCRDDLVDDPHNPLSSPAKMAEQPDPRLDRLAESVQAMGDPFGVVVAGVGYDYDQWLHVYGIEDGVVAFTKDNAPVTLLDPESLEPRWALRPDTKRIAWDASGDRFLILDLSADKATRVSAYDIDDGERVWCTGLGQKHADGDPVSTTFLGSGDVITALPDDDRVVLTRLAGDTGKKVWDRSYATVARADFVGQLSDNLVLAGGSEEFRLAEQAPDSSGVPLITAMEASDGNPAWTWEADAGSQVHVVGIDAGRAIAVERGRGGVRLFALSDTGDELWSVEPQDAAYQATLRGGVILMKTAAALYGYDVETGELLWTQEVPTDRTYFPYGFTLDQMPSLDDDHVLVPTTTDLVALDVHDGTQESYPMPVDGINTTYWPYQLLATPDLVGVVTNTGAVIARREPVG